MKLVNLIGLLALLTSNLPPAFADNFSQTVHSAGNTAQEARANAASEAHNLFETACPNGWTNSSINITYLGVIAGGQYGCTATVSCNCNEAPPPQSAPSNVDSSNN
jgi:hypothetical protein